VSDETQTNGSDPSRPGGVAEKISEHRRVCQHAVLRGSGASLRNAAGSRISGEHWLVDDGIARQYTAEQSQSRIRREMRRTNRSWRVDETYVRVAGKSTGFRSVDGALRSIAGYGAMNITRKGQIRWLRKGDIVGQKRFIERIFSIAA
jgi:hypothetical protein